MPRGLKRKSEFLSSDTSVDGSIGPVDEHVGARISARRRLLQLSQKEMAEKLGITFQQVQKYEKGVNRIGAGRLYGIAQILGVDIDYFYDDLNANKYSQVADYNNGYGLGFVQEEGVEQKFEPMNGAEATMLLKAFYSLPSKARSALLLMLTTLREKDDANSDL